MSKTLDPLTSAPLPLFFRYAWPSILGLLAISTASIIDGMFVGHWVGADALAAINLISPFISIIYSIGLMICIGTSLSAGKRLGEKDPQGASQIFTQSFILLVFISSMVVLTITLNLNNFLSLMTVPNGLFPFIYDYFHILLPFILIQILSLFLYFFVKVDKQPSLAAAALIIGALTNIILDAIFIVPLGLGIKGAAWATGLSQCIQLIFLLRYFFIPERQLFFVVPTKKIHELAKSCFNGVSELINGITDSIMVIIINWMLIKQAGAIGVAAFSALNYVLMIAMVITFGLSDAMQVLITQNFGAKQSERIYQLRHLGFITAFVIGVISMLSILFFPETIVGLFIGTQHSQAIKLAQEMSAFIWPLFITSGINAIAIGYFTAIHKPKHSSILAILRTFILPSGLLIITFWIFQDLSALIALPLADGIAMLLGLSLMIKMTPERVILSQITQESGLKETRHLV
ncbi:MATE family efflux transporter [uncultured Shewanella sp.]|uniref:MATE family efflux transporter n=1 Tax=uncultured Shewanella sp. TaxID=173975 RepID=UPI00261D1F59|nr:MATE family efflux transporter [uncultured Shewanella sp.]